MTMEMPRHHEHQISATIPVIGASAYRTARAKVQATLQALAISETERALAVAEFSSLYRTLPTNEDIKLTIRIVHDRIDLTLHGETSPSLNERIRQQSQHFFWEASPSSTPERSNYLLSRHYRAKGDIDLSQAGEWLLGSTTEELKLRAAQTEEANAAKREFLSRMSHELRTPMNAIIGMTHLALRTELNSRQRDYLEKIRSAGENLLGIINDILDFSKIEAGKLTLENTDFRVDKVLGDVANLVADRIFSKGVELLFSVDETVPPCLNGDPLRLTQVLVNLLANAAKFTERGQISLRVSLQERSTDQVILQFEVQDTGIGMTEAQMAQLFQAFSQADVSTTRRYGGTGLGLSICQRLLELMGGNILVASRPGEGSCFQARACFGLAQPTPAPVVPAGLNQLRVLVVDDNADAREVMAGLLAHLPVDVTTTESGEKALALMEAASRRGAPFGLVLLDWQLGEGIDGLEMASRVRRQDSLGRPRIVLVTAYGREEAERQAEAETVHAYLNKPVRPSELIDTLAGLFAPEKQDARQSTREHHNSRDQAWNLQDLHVLLVEDNPINQQIACELLEIVGVQVTTAGNGVEALRWLEEHSPDSASHPQSAERQLPCDLVLMDLNMPEMDGWECVRRIRGQQRWQQLPILAMTAHAMQQERDNCLELGMQDHIIKPIEPDRLYERLRHWSGRADKTPGPLGSPVSMVAAAHEPLSSEAGADVLRALDGFDREAGLRRVSGNTVLYLRLLRSLLHTQSDALERLDGALQREAFAEASHLVHTIKGVAANLGAVALADAAACLETALRSGACPDGLLRQFAEQHSLSMDTLRRAFGGEADALVTATAGGSHERLSREQLDEILSLERFLASSDGEALERVEILSDTLIQLLGTAGHARLVHLVQSFAFPAALNELRRHLPANPRSTSITSER